MLRADDVPLDLIESLGRTAVEMVGEKRSTWRRWNLYAEAARQTMGWRFASTQDREAIVGMVVDAAENASLRLAPPELAFVPVVFRRPDGSSAFRPKHSAVYSSEELLAAEDRAAQTNRRKRDRRHAPPAITPCHHTEHQRTPAECSAVVLPVVQKAIASAVKVILRADDSSGIIGDVIRGLLKLHAEVARKEPPPASKLVAWMIKFQFDGEQDFFEIDPAAYAPALGEKGLALYRAKLDEIAEQVDPEPSKDQERAVWEQRFADPVAWEQSANERHARFLLEWNARRLAVVDRDVDAIIATHSRDR